MIFSQSLTRQLGPLERQSEASEGCILRKRKNSRACDINMFLLETERIKEQIRDLDSKYQIASRRA